MRKPEDFQKFYYAKVGLGEACGCAEKVIDVYEFNRTEGARPAPAGRGIGRPSWLARLLRRLRRSPG